MKRVCAFSWASCAALWLLTGVVSAQGGGFFEFGFAASPQQTAPDLIDPVLLEIDCIQNDGPPWPAGSLADHTGAPGATTRGTYFCTILQNDPCTGAVPIPNPDPPPAEILGPCTGGTRGGQGWQMSFSASGCDAVILGVTATQTDIAPGTVEDCEKGPGGEGGFDNTELTSGLKDTPPFVGEPNDGVVHAIVLHLKKGTTLDPSGINFKPATGPEQNPATVCRFLVECTNPVVRGQMCDLTLAFVDGLEGSGEPVENKVTQDGQSVIPTLTSEVIRKTVPMELPIATLKFSEPASEISSCEPIALKVHLSNTCEVSSFSFGISHDGSVLRPVDAISSGVTEELRRGLGPEFWFTDVDPVVTDCSSTAGLVVSMIAHFGNPFLGGIPIGEDQEITTITYEPVAGVAQGSETSLEFVDCLRADQETEHTLTTVICGLPSGPTLKESGMVRIASDCFQRGDCNSDGQFDMSDAVTALLHVFAEDQILFPVTCLDACDANDDGALDISDGVRKLQLQFRGGLPLPAPFAVCGADETGATLGCELGSPCEN